MMTMNNTAMSLLVRLVSDVVHFNSHSRYKYKNIDDLVLGKGAELRRRYYGSIGKYNRKILVQLRWSDPSLCADISVRDVVYQLSNYSLIWEQLTAVYPRVSRLYSCTFFHAICNTCSFLIDKFKICFVFNLVYFRTKFYYWMGTDSQQILSQHWMK